MALAVGGRSVVVGAPPSDAPLPVPHAHLLVSPQCSKCLVVLPHPLTTPTLHFGQVKATSVEAFSWVCHSHLSTLLLHIVTDAISRVGRTGNSVPRSPSRTWWANSKRASCLPGQDGQGVQARRHEHRGRGPGERQSDQARHRMGVALSRTLSSRPTEQAKGVLPAGKINQKFTAWKSLEKKRGRITESKGGPKARDGEKTKRHQWRMGTTPGDMCRAL